MTVIYYTYFVKHVGCVKFLHRRFRSISVSSALTEIQTDYALESRKARRTEKKRVLLKSPYNHQFSDSQDHACNTFILDCASFSKPIHPSLSFTAKEKLDTAVAHSVRLCSFIQHSSFIILLCTN